MEEGGREGGREEEVGIGEEEEEEKGGREGGSGGGEERGRSGDWRGGRAGGGREGCVEERRKLGDEFGGRGEMVEGNKGKECKKDGKGCREGRLNSPICSVHILVCSSIPC